jgi:hypothetical protein
MKILTGCLREHELEVVQVGVLGCILRVGQISAPHLLFFSQGSRRSYALELDAGETGQPQVGRHRHEESPSPVRVRGACGQGGRVAGDKERNILTAH